MCRKMRIQEDRLLLTLTSRDFMSNVVPALPSDVTSTQYYITDTHVLY